MNGDYCDGLMDLGIYGWEWMGGWVDLLVVMQIAGWVGVYS